ncbi:hypothetical protein [Prescottella equi]|uniref:hypothetical protein n=1 Tax=Rhodococcus hoagii TaxID=43767 RepID=UPI001C76E3EB|nr:hypothetical protein [Prescottella equi]BCN46601.1 hypothetical protein RE9414_48810 [Prescottella equi]
MTSSRSLRVTLEALAQGLAEPPASDDHSTVDRWTWFSGLYADQTWGLVAAIPGFPRIAADQIAGACRATASGTATVDQWRAIDSLAASGLAATQTRSLTLAWSAAIDTATDAFDYLAGHDFGGLEAILGAFEAVLTQYPAPVAAAFVDGALTAWARQLDPSLRRAA